MTELSNVLEERDRRLIFLIKAFLIKKHAVEVRSLEPILKEACSQGYPESAICVQRFDDSLNSAIRITYRISLRSSSLREPRYPLLRVVQRFVLVFLFRKGGFHKNEPTRLNKK